MSKILEIPDSHLPELRLIYEQKAKEIIDGAIAYKNKWAEIEPMLKQLDISLRFPNYYSSSKSSSSNSKDISRQLTWLDRCVAILKQENRPLTAIEIFELLVERDSSINKQIAKNSIPGTLSTAGSSGKIKRFKSENDEWLYALPDGDNVINLVSKIAAGNVEDEVEI